MDNIKVYKPPSGVSQVESFIDGLEPKLREKLVWQIFRLSHTPPVGLKEPHYKHFSIEKYRGFYELQEKNCVVVRVIFTVRPNGEVLSFSISRTTLSVEVSWLVSLKWI